MILAQTVTENLVCARIACGFSFAHIWALCELKIPFLAKDVSLEINALALKRGSVTNFPRYHSEKAIRGA